jgi:hypothetical protein
MTTTDYNFRQIDSKLLIIVDLVLFAVITSVGGIGTIESLDFFTLDYNIGQLCRSAYSVAFTIALRYLLAEFIKKYKNYKRKKNDGKETN